MSLYLSLIIPYCEKSLSDAKGTGTQKMREEISQQIQASLILCRFGKFLETMENYSSLIEILKDYVLSEVNNFQKL